MLEISRRTKLILAYTNAFLQATQRMINVHRLIGMNFVNVAFASLRQLSSKGIRLYVRRPKSAADN